MTNDYKELPCRRCGRVWKWAVGKKSEPYCPKGYGCETTPSQELFSEIFKRLDDIEMKINRITSMYPTTSTKPSLGPTICSKCGMKWEGTMGYNCFLSDCPVQLKMTSQISDSTRDFNIESPDPDQRTWYYDGDGTKRRKE